MKEPSARRSRRFAIIACALGATVGCGLILGVGNEQYRPLDDGGAGDAGVEPSAADSTFAPDAHHVEVTPVDGMQTSSTLVDAFTDGEGSEEPPPLQARYGGGRVLVNPAKLVAIYWGQWEAASELHFESAYEPFFEYVVGSTSFTAIDQYYGMIDGGRVPIAINSLLFSETRHFNDPEDGGVGDPNALIESLAVGDGPDTIYVVFFPPNTNLCASQDGCSGLTPNQHIPYIRLEYNNDYVSSSRAGFRELVDVITDSDGDGWTVPYGGQSYRLGQLCSRGAGGGGLGSEATLRLWDDTVVYATDGMFSALSNGGKGACINTLATRALLAAVAADGGTMAFPLIGSPVPPGGLSASLVPNTSAVSVAAGPLGIAYDGFWTMSTDSGLYTETDPVTNDLSQAWESYTTIVSPPAPYTLFSPLDVTMQGVARWDAFMVGSAVATDAAAPLAQLFHFYWDQSLSRASGGWTPFGDGTSVPGVTRISSGPGVTSFAPGRIDAFVLGAAADGNHLLHVWCDDRQNGVHVMGTNCDAATAWADLGTPPDGVALVGDPDAASWPSGMTDSGHLAVVCAAADGTLRLWQDDDGTATWTVLAPPAGQTFASSPAITGMGDRRYLVAARTTDGAVWQWLYDWGPGSWSKSSLATPSIAIDVTSY